MEFMSKMTETIEKSTDGGGARAGARASASASAIRLVADEAADTASITSIYESPAYAESLKDIHIKPKAYEALKRVLDILFSLFALVVLAPVFLIVAICIKLEDGDPIIFRQLRNGRDGKEFWMYKFRSMVKEAPQMHRNLLQYNEMQGPAFKLKDDPRITKVGYIIRRTSIDELPQLLNVIKGDMSIVGPRPLPTYETSQCNAIHNRRLLVKPGLTCYWQINGRNNIEFDEWMELDWKYVKERSLKTDAKIVLKTFGVVVSGNGAN
ncbi:MAG: sugar transferase [Lachnospiraceae bacterium]|nr:sugar transferase [Lachnospiraceae bacterium]